MICSCLSVENPGSENVTVYAPTGSLRKRKYPVWLVTCVRMPIKAGELASAVTPGTTPPVSSRTTPSIAPSGVCPQAGNDATKQKTTNPTSGRRPNALELFRSFTFIIPLLLSRLSNSPPTI